MGRPYAIFFRLHLNGGTIIATVKMYCFFKNSFRNFRADHIGVSVNFAAGQNLEDNVEIIAMIGTEQVGFMESFDITIISKPEMLHLRTDILTELEVKFVNLTTGAVFPSIHSHEFSEEIYVSMSFDNAF